ncbi:MBL fold metallo-hydrolase [Desulfobacterales bacterium HSG16]|nr:MBL fold metallo-hydrolase [Desulfobacterales bacterium HSG16]
MQFVPGKNNPAFLKEPDRGKKTITWIGHSTLLIQIQGINILTDPIFSKRASPFQWAGPERVAEPGVEFQDLPEIDVVLISHDHYDHLDKNTIKKLRQRKNGHKTLFLVPLGLKKWFQRAGVKNVQELDWWDTYITDDVVFHAIPVQHWSKRGLFARNNTLWAGWIVKAFDFSFLFAGDTGYSPTFVEIGRRFGPFDLAALPIGAYAPRWFMAYQHVNPEEAVQIHLDIKSKKSIAIHWGTFILSDEPLDEPIKKLESAKQTMKINDESFKAVSPGTTLTF